MSAVEEFYGNLVAAIAEAAKKRDADVVQIRARASRDFWTTSHEVEVRWAQYILEVADYERQRMSLIRDMATIKMHQCPVLLVDGL